ncbi:MAG: extracellular solute-binding protein [Treponema sp.]|jgi:hypothetical protein|nr:extracellular solute-binding protein [Treponema sp.]
MKRFLKVGVITITLILAAALFVLAGCKGETSKEISLNGKTVLIASASGYYDVDTLEPRSEDEAAILEARKRLLLDNDLHMRVDTIGEYATYFSLMVNMIMSGNKEYSVYELEPAKALTLYKQGLLFPLSDTGVDMPANAYNKMLEKLFTFNGKVYASGLGRTADAWQDCLIFYNKRMFQQLGEDPDVLYNMQRDGTWTWDVFLNYIKRLTVDFDNNGVIDQYGIAMDRDATWGLLESLVYSNNANFVTIDANGKFQDATNTPEFLEAVQFYMTLFNERLIKIPAEVLEERTASVYPWGFSFWDFMDGKVGMIMAPEWVKTMFGDMADDWGMVMPPKGPRASGYRVGSSAPVFIIPSIFTKDEAAVALTAFKAWDANVLTGRVNDPEGWKESHWWAHRDTRAINETGTMQRNDNNVVFKTNIMVPGYVDGPMQDFMDGLAFADVTPSQYIQQFTPLFRSLIDEANR